MRYIHYKLEDYLADPKFKNWVVNPSTDLDHFWQSFLQQYPGKAGDVIKAKRIILGLNFPDPAQVQTYSREDLEKLIEEVFERSETGADFGSHDKFGIYTLWNRFNWTFRAASVLLLGFSIGIFWLLPFNSPESIENDASVALIAKTTEKGQKLTIKLEDGTLVRLNSGSTLSYPEHFDSIRTIHLKGEAYFDVEEDRNRPFEVITPGVRTTVLGTKFGIDHNQETKQIKIALLEGKVKVEKTENLEPSSERHILDPMEMLTLSLEEEHYTKDIFEYNTFFGWKDNLLVFKNDGFSDVVKKLEDWYGVEFIIRKQISDEKDFTGEYQNEILKNVLVGMGYTFDFEYELVNKTVIIK